MENERIKFTCPNCKEDIYLTFNTIDCPKCGFEFPEGSVKKIFYRLESARANSKLIQFGDKMQKTGTGLQNAGNAMDSVANTMLSFGCLFIVLIIVVLFIL